MAGVKICLTSPVLNKPVASHKINNIEKSRKSVSVVGSGSKNFEGGMKAFVSSDHLANK